MTKLVKIFKPGEPDLKILPEHLDQHKKLGWTVAADQSDDAEEQADDTGKDGAITVKASEAAKKLAADNNLDIAKVTGTGKDGAITVGDVQKAIEAAKAAQ